MISDKAFLNLIQDKTLGTSKEELEQILNEELEKPEDKMDADLIEYCLDSLSKLESTEDLGLEKEKVGDSNGKRIRYSLKRVAAIAAAAVLMIVGMVSVSAIAFNVNLFDSLVEFYDNHIRIRFDNSNDKADEYKLLGSELAKELAENGISPVLLPEELLTKKCKITSVTYEKLDAVTSVIISYTKNGKKSYMAIDQYDLESAVPYTDYLHSSTTSFRYYRHTFRMATI
jgi:hypothetical protein